MKEAVIRPNLSDEFLFEDDTYITELYNSFDDPNLSIARARVEPGVTTRWHRHKGTAEYYYIISGRGIAEIGDLPPREVNAGDIALIPEMCKQRITNIGSEDLILLAICTPRFTDDVYEDVEENSV